MTKVENDGTNRRRFLLGAGLAGAGAVAAGCTGSGAESGDDSQNLAGGDGGNAKPGKEVTLGFSAPAANHGWMAAISDNARAQAKAFEDVTLDATEGTNDVNKQISAVKSLIAKKVDALVVLPFNGESLTAVAKEAMSKGIPVVNVDRIFASHLAYRTWMGGDNYGMGVNAGNFVAERLKQQGKTKNPVIIEVRGIANLPLTQDRSAGFEEALAEHGLKVTAQQAADFTPQEGRKVMGQLLQAHSHIDAVWNHDDDQGVGVLAAVEQAGRTDEFFMVGGAGSKRMMKHIQSADGPMVATVLYPPTMAASAISLGRLVAQGRAVDALAEKAIPTKVTAYSAVVTKKNVDQYMSVGF